MRVNSGIKGINELNPKKPETRLHFVSFLMHFCFSSAWKVWSLLAHPGPKGRPQVWQHCVWLAPVSIPGCSGALSLGQIPHDYWQISLEPLNSMKLSKFLMTGKLLQRCRGREHFALSACRNKICWTELFKAGPNCSRNKFIGKSCKIVEITRASNSFERPWRYTQKGYLKLHPPPPSQINPKMGKPFCGQQSLIPFVQAECNAAAGLLQTRSWTAIWLVRASFLVLVSSKCWSEGEEGLTFLRVGAGCPASSTFPRAAATRQGVFEVVMVAAWPGQMISAVVAEITGAPIETSWLNWPRVSFFPHLHSSKECLWQEPATMLWRSCQPASPGNGEEPPLGP